MTIVATKSEDTASAHPHSYPKAPTQTVPGCGNGGILTEKDHVRESLSCYDISIHSIPPTADAIFCPEGAQKFPEVSNLKCLRFRHAEWVQMSNLAYLWVLICALVRSPTNLLGKSLKCLWI